MIWWATVWCAILGSWPAAALVVPLERRQDADDSSDPAPPPPPPQPNNQSSQGVIIGLSAGVAVVVLTGITLVICYPPRKWTRGRLAKPVKPWIKQTTTTTVTSHSRSGSSESTDSLTDRAAPLPMTRVASIDKRGRYLISKEAAVGDAVGDHAGPSSRRPPASLQRYSVHVTSKGNSVRSSRGSGPLSPLPEEIGGAPKVSTSETTPITPIGWPYDAMVSPSPPMVSPMPGKSDLADRRGRPALQSIQVPSPPSLKGKGKARVYYY